MEADEGSSKAFRAILTHRRLLQPLVGGVMLTSIEELRGLRLISFPEDE